MLRTFISLLIFKGVVEVSRGEGERGVVDRGRRGHLLQDCNYKVVLVRNLAFYSFLGCSF